MCTFGVLGLSGEAPAVPGTPETAQKMIFSSGMFKDIVKQLRPEKNRKKRERTKDWKNTRKTKQKYDKKTLLGQSLGQKRSKPKAVNPGAGRKRSGPKAVRAKSGWSKSGEPVVDGLRCGVW